MGCLAPTGGERWPIEHAMIADLLPFAEVVVPSPDEQTKEIDPLQDRIC